MQNENEKQLLKAFIEQPTTYHIEVLDGSMLPKNLQEKNEISFVVKPPTMQTFLQAALLLMDIPEELLKKEQPTLQDIAPYGPVMIKVLCTMSYARKEPYPDWYEPFLAANTTPSDVYLMFAETAMKMKTDFFLSSFHIANQNPLMIRKPKRKPEKNPDDSTPTS